MIGNILTQLKIEEPSKKKEQKKQVKNPMMPYMTEKEKSNTYMTGKKRSITYIRQKGKSPSHIYDREGEILMTTTKEDAGHNTVSQKKEEKCSYEDNNFH